MYKCMSPASVTSQLKWPFISETGSAKASHQSLVSDPELPVETTIKDGIDCGVTVHKNGHHKNEGARG